MRNGFQQVFSFLDPDSNTTWNSPVGKLISPRLVLDDLASRDKDSHTMFRVLLSASVALLVPAFGSAKDQIHTFKKLRLTDQFWSEGANFGDFNRDGKIDIV